MCCIHVLRGHSKPVTQLHLVRGRLYTAAGGAIRVWDAAGLRMVDRIQTSLYSGGIRSMMVGLIINGVGWGRGVHSSRNRGRQGCSVGPRLRTL